MVLRAIRNVIVIIVDGDNDTADDRSSSKNREDNAGTTATFTEFAFTGDGSSSAYGISTLCNSRRGSQRNSCGCSK